LLILVAVPAFAGITADQLREQAAHNERDAQQRSQRANTGEIGALLKERAAPVRSSKYGASAEPAPTPDTAIPARAQQPSRRRSVAPPTVGTADPVPAAPSAVAAPAGDSHIYIPPPMSSGAGKPVVDAVTPAANFGIRLGSWIEAELKRNTTSAETGAVELVVTASFAGDRGTLPAGTVVFADKGLNATTKRMEMRVTHGITPAGKEFDMQGLIFAPDKVPGLAGVFVLNRKEVVTSGVTKGALAAVGAAVGQVTGNPVTSAATNAATSSVLNDTAQASQFNNGQQAVIYVSPQPLLIRVERQF
jgi:hypothetical protein